MTSEFGFGVVNVLRCNGQFDRDLSFSYYFHAIERDSAERAFAGRDKKGATFVTVSAFLPLR